MARTDRRFLAVLVTLAVASLTPAAAQAPQPDRAPGHLGIDRLECDCTLGTGPLGGRWLYRFRSAPVVRGTESGGPAEGVLLPGDTIVAVDGRPVLEPAGADRMANPIAGEQVTVDLRRAGRPHRVRIVARSRKAADLQAYAPASPAGSATMPDALPGGGRQPATIVPSGDFEPSGWLGIALACRGCGWARSAGQASPIWESAEAPVVARLSPSGPAARAGLRAGDRITHVDSVSVTTADGGRRLGAVEPGRPVRLRVERDGRIAEFLVTPAARELTPAGAGRAPETRYRGRVGNVDVEVVAVEGTDVVAFAEGHDIAIRIGDAVVRLRARAAPGAAP